MQPLSASHVQGMRNGSVIGEVVDHGKARKVNRHREVEMSPLLMIEWSYNECSSSKYIGVGVKG